MSTSQARGLVREDTLETAIVGYMAILKDWVEEVPNLCGSGNSDVESNRYMIGSLRALEDTLQVLARSQNHQSDLARRALEALSAREAAEQRHSQDPALEDELRRESHALIQLLAEIYNGNRDA